MTIPWNGGSHACAWNDRVVGGGSSRNLAVTAAGLGTLLRPLANRILSSEPDVPI
jgi:hypothetical protein